MFDDSKVIYSVHCLPEDTPIRGNVAATGNDAEDKAIEDMVIADLAGGNEWVWCVVRVVAEYDGIDFISGDAYMGGCSYRNRNSFMCSDYYQDMCDEARDELYMYLESHIIALRQADIVD
jgi:hypothetical protein